MLPERGTLRPGWDNDKIKAQGKSEHPKQREGHAKAPGHRGVWPSGQPKGQEAWPQGQLARPAGRASEDLRLYPKHNAKPSESSQATGESAPSGLHSALSRRRWARSLRRPGPAGEQGRTGPERGVKRTRVPGLWLAPMGGATTVPPSEMDRTGLGVGCRVFGPGG